MSAKVAVITGASSGFGAELVRRFASNSWIVVAAARRADRLQILAEEFPKKVIPLVLDVTDAPAVRAAFTRLRPQVPQIDLLINNAGLARGMGPAQQSQLDDWAEMISTNCGGVANVTHSLLPGFVEHNSGHIVNVGSVAGSTPYPGGNVYGATKAFVHQFSANLRADLAGTNIKVTSIEPGTCEGTEFSTVRFNGDTKRARDVYEGFQAVRASDIADIIWWISSTPPHLDITRVEVMPVAQTPNGFAIHRT